MTRRFVLVSHTIDPSGDWGLDDLCGDGGRVDVAARFLNSALFLSHGIRDDVETYIVVVTDPQQPRTVRVQGSGARSFNPDERNLASHLRAALSAPCPDPWWHDVAPGLAVAPFDLAGLLDDLGGPVVLLDPDGTPIEDAGPDDLAGTFVLSDHRPFEADEYALLRDRSAAEISLGPHWYHGNHVVSVVHFMLDRTQQREVDAP